MTKAWCLDMTSFYGDSIFSKFSNHDVIFTFCMWKEAENGIHLTRACISSKTEGMNAGMYNCSEIIIVSINAATKTLQLVQCKRHW